MPRYPEHITKLMTEYSLTADEVWQVHGSTWVLKHKAVERIGAQLGIRWQAPKVIEGSTADKTVVVLVTGELPPNDTVSGSRTEWSFGEASPANNKNAYPWAMAEKRGKDRVILKFLAAHGDVYSEEEADDFKQRGAPRQDDYEAPGEPAPAGEVVPSTRYDRHVKEGLSQVPSKAKPAGWDDCKAIINDATDYADLMNKSKKPFFVNTTSAWSNYWLLKFSVDVFLPKVAEFRGTGVAMEMERKVRDKYPLERVQEAAE